MPSIGNISFETPLLLGPMAGVTDSAFRSICRKEGAAGCYTEMVSAKALLYQDKKSRQLLFIAPEEHPCGVQIFGSEPEVCAQAAQLALEISGADFVDINMGCPMPKITGNGEGSALMRNIPQAEKLIRAVRQAVQVPLTVKFRKGYEADEDTCVEFGRMAQACGVDAVCVHGRTRQQMYAGKSDLSAVLRVKEALSIPVIASGDMFTPEDAQRALQGGADFVMVARGAQGDPQVFRRMKRALEGLPPEKEPALSEKIALMDEHIALMCQRKGESRAMPEARKHILWYLKGVRGAKPFKLEFSHVNTLAQFRALCRKMEEQLG
ncbi:tRNA dihydrouridine synthase DusB [Intestinimonas butyriciproducens]|uniref:tRNA dihydrouridine synthase DusB n=1 Tax=Intestinimonas butyriciproducens TaxID=1297617 RepID=UPI001958CE5E|nr:tRNA dihydrouridine synthase DusB [Intestinimonas butyriciproducens]